MVLISVDAYFHELKLIIILVIFDISKNGVAMLGSH